MSLLHEPSDPAPRVTLIVKGGCSLCDAAREVVARVCSAAGTGWAERWLEDDDELRERHFMEVPVVLVDGFPHDFWRIDPARLERALSVPRG